MKSNIINRFAWEGSPYHLAFFRMAISLHVVYACSVNTFDFFVFLGESQKGMLTIWPSSLDELIAEKLIMPLRYIAIASGVLMFFGLFTKWATRILAIAFLFLFGFYYQSANAPVHWLYFWFPLLYLGFARTADVWSIDALIKKQKLAISRSEYRWPIELGVAWFVYIYFAAGIAKIFPLNKGMGWLSGGTSQNIIFNRFLDSPWYFILGKPFFDYSQHGWVFGLLSVLALALEMFTIVLLFTNRFHIIVWGLLYVMHLFLYMAGVASFSQMALVLGIVLINPSFFNKYERK